LQELAAEDIAGYQNFLRMYPDVFNELVNKVSPLISRQNTNMRAAIPADLRLALTLRFLATGDSYMSHQYSFRVAANTIGKIVPETCRALYQVLKADFLQCPRTQDAWQEVINGFWERWQMPNTVGALDGKHIVLRKPLNSGSTYFNYKSSFSIVLMALVDYDYKFLFLDIGKQGRVSDGGVFSSTALYRGIESGSLHLPPPAPLPGDSEPVPNFIVADEAFPLRQYLMKPYPSRNLTNAQRIFNYRLSRARRIAENAFGILASRFRVFLKPLLLSPERAQFLVLACCALHNMLRVRYPSAMSRFMDTEDPVTHDVTSGIWRSQETMQSLHVMKGNNSTKAAKAQRDYICHYLNSAVGSVEWQDRMI
jgi:hypothetical protein